MPQKFSNPNPTDHGRIFTDPFGNRRGVGPRRPSQSLPCQTPDFRAPAEGLSMVWLGHSSVLLRMGGKNILIDPMFSRWVSPVPFVGPKRFPGPVVTPSQLPELDLVLITHNHYDHCDRATLRSLDGQVKQYLAPTGVGRVIQRFGIQPSKIRELGWHEQATIDDIQIICTPSQHNSARTGFDWNRTLWCSYVLKDGCYTVFNSGDGGFGAHFEEIHARYGAPDLAIMECGQYGERWLSTHMFPEESVEACQILQARLAVPVHWGAYRLSDHPWDDPPRRFRQRALELNQAFHVPTLYEVISIK